MIDSGLFARNIGVVLRHLTIRVQAITLTKSIIIIKKNKNKKTPTFKQTYASDSCQSAIFVPEIRRIRHRLPLHVSFVSRIASIIQNHDISCVRHRRCYRILRLRVSQFASRTICLCKMRIMHGVSGILRKLIDRNVTNKPGSRTPTTAAMHANAKHSINTVGCSEPRRERDWVRELHFRFDIDERSAVTRPTIDHVNSDSVVPAMLTSEIFESSRGSSRTMSNSKPDVEQSSSRARHLNSRSHRGDRCDRMCEIVSQQNTFCGNETNEYLCTRTGVRQVRYGIASLSAG